MSPLATITIGIITLLLTMLAAIARQDDNVEIRKILAWILFVLITLLFPNFIIIWLTMQMAAQMIASTIDDLSSFTSQVAWWTAGIGMIYPAIWGTWLQPKIRIYIKERILHPAEASKENRNHPSKHQGEKPK
jgi:DMSO/TMAO reductase YedYZ heme-binding membrane subunit